MESKLKCQKRGRLELTNPGWELWKQKNMVVLFIFDELSLQGATAEYITELQSRSTFLPKSGTQEHQNTTQLRNRIVLIRPIQVPKWIALGDLWFFQAVLMYLVLVHCHFNRSACITLLTKQVYCK